MTSLTPSAASSSTSWTMSPSRRLTSSPRTIGHDAEGARVVAADLDRDPGRVVDVAPGRERRRVRLVLLEDLHDRPLEPRPLEQRRARWRGCGCRTRRRRGPARSTMSSRSFWARQPPTAICRSGRAVLQRLQAAEVAVELVVGVLPDAAGVEDDDVGRLRVVGRLHALGCRAARRCAPSRARSSGTRRCARRSGGARSRRSLRSPSQARLLRRRSAEPSCRESTGTCRARMPPCTSRPPPRVSSLIIFGSLVQGTIGFGPEPASSAPVVALVLPEALPGTLVVRACRSSARHGAARAPSGLDRHALPWVAPVGVPGTVLGVVIVARCRRGCSAASSVRSCSSPSSRSRRRPPIRLHPSAETVARRGLGGVTGTAAAIGGAAAWRCSSSTTRATTLPADPRRRASRSAHRSCRVVALAARPARSPRPSSLLALALMPGDLVGLAEQPFDGHVDTGWLRPSVARAVVARRCGRRSVAA